MNNSLKMQLKPEWEEIETVRSRVAEFLVSIGHGDATIDAISMVSSELVENAVKHGSYERPEAVIHYSLQAFSSVLVVEVKSPIDEASKANLQELDETIQWIRGHQSPFEAYVEKLKEVSARSEQATSGLGMVRIAYEGQSILDFFVDERDMLAMSAVYHI